MSELALKLIEENKRTRSPFLDLGNCGLTEVPEEIGELVWLEELSFATEWESFDGNKWIRFKTQNFGLMNNITRLVPNFGNISFKYNFFSNLTKLYKLYLNVVHWRELMDFNDLSPLSSLTNLQCLALSRTNVINLYLLSVASGNLI